jgi:hypothetical protein
VFVQTTILFFSISIALVKSLVKSSLGFYVLLSSNPHVPRRRRRRLSTQMSFIPTLSKRTFAVATVAGLGAAVFSTAGRNAAMRLYSASLGGGRVYMFNSIPVVITSVVIYVVLILILWYMSDRFAASS